MKILKIIAIVIVVFSVILAGLAWFGSRPLTHDQAAVEIKSAVDSTLNAKKSIYAGLVYVDAPQKGISVKYAAGTSAGQPVDADQPFHVASVGKLFTATLIGHLMDEGRLHLDDPIHTYLDDAVLENLFVVDGVDYKDQVTVGQLLSHTSGVADYFAKEDNGLQDALYLSPDTFYTPQSLLQYTREHQHAVFAPGTGYHYSDTGYILLGLIIESVTGQSFDETLHAVIFDPLHMDDTYLMFYSDPVNGKRPIVEVWVDGHEVSRNESVSMDWAGGGVVSTLDNLAVFIRALYHGEIIHPETLQSLNRFAYEFMPGINYGYGFMQMQFEKFFPTLGFLPKMTGHMGILGTELFYDRATDMVYVASFGSSDASSDSIRTMITILSDVYRVRE